jgi:hypothetical protein
VAYSDVWARASDGGWTRIGLLHSAREHLAAATDGKGSVWFLGGVDVRPRELLRDVDQAHGSKVTPATPLPKPLQGLTAVWTARSGLCAIGGSTTPPNVANVDRRPVPTVTCFPSAQAFPDLPQPSYLPGAAVIGGDVYVVAGSQMYRLSTSP